MSKKSNKPLEVAPWANKAHEEAMARKEEEAEMRELYKEMLGIVLMCIIAFVLINAMYMWL